MARARMRLWRLPRTSEAAIRPVAASHSRMEWSQLAEKTCAAVGHTTALTHAVWPAKLVIAT